MAQKTKVNVLREQHHLHLLHKMWRDAFSHFAIFSKYLIEMDFWSKIIPKLVNIEVFERKRIMRACARNFYLDKIHFLILFGIIVGARAPASAPAFFGVALRLALRGNFLSCAPTALRLPGTPLRSGAPRSAAFQYSVFGEKIQIRSNHLIFGAKNRFEKGTTFLTFLARKFK